MSEDIEVAVFRLISQPEAAEEIEALEPALRPEPGMATPSRAYWGSEVCYDLLPSVTALERGIEAFRARGIDLTLVTPAMVGEAHLDRLTRWLECLDAAGTPTEVVVNDWGVLEFIRQRAFEHLVPLLGRALNKRERDPRVDVDSWPDPVRAAARQTILSSPHMVRFLADRHVAAVEFDNAWSGFDLADAPRDIARHVYCPHVLMSLQRICLHASTSVDEPDKFRLGAACKHDCRDYMVRRRPAHPIHGHELAVWQAGRGIYGENDAVPEPFEEFDRWVITIL